MHIQHPNPSANGEMPTDETIAAETIAGDPLDFMMALVSDSAAQVEALRGELAQMHAQLAAMNEKENSRAAVFDALYRELQDYKDDFVSERTKPLLRALLFCTIRCCNSTTNCKIALQHSKQVLASN